MNITFLGTGAGPGSDQRSSTGILVQNKGSMVLFDCGPGAATNLSYANARASDVDAVLVTHLHSDHIPGLWSLFSFAMRGAGRTLPDVFGPRGVVEIVSKLNELIEAHAKVLGRENVPVANAIEAPTERVFELKDLRAEARTTLHEPDVHALCYRIEAYDTVIVFSGDTTPNRELLMDFARGADLLIHEAYSAAEVVGTSDGVPPEIAERRAQAFRQYHTPAAVAAEIATAAAVKRLALTHIPRWNTAEAIFQEARQQFSGPLEVAYDGLSIEL